MRKLPIFLLVLILTFSMMLTPEPAKASLISTINRTNGPTSFSGGSGSDTANITLGYTPTAGRTIVLVIQTYSAGAGVTPVTGITQTGVTWAEGGAHAVEEFYMQTAEVWYGVVGAGASSTIIVTATGVAAGGVIEGYVMEYDQVLMPDQAAKNDSYSGTNPVTGTTGATTTSPEIWIGCIANRGSATTTLSSPMNGFTLTYMSALSYTRVALLEKNVALGTTGTAGSGVTDNNANKNCGIIVTFKNNPASPPSSYAYTLSAKWENGTATTQTVTITEVGSTTSFNVTGTPTEYYFTTQPISFSWDLGAGVSRSIFIVGPTASIIFTKPTLTSAVYSFTIQDYTASLGEADSYLEAWRTIGGTPTLVERELIFNKASTTPLTLELYAAYNILIRLPDNSTENYGYFVPTTNSPPYLTITKLSFAQMYQPVTKYVTDSIVRVNSTHIRLTYNDTLLQTSNTTVTISTRAGAVAYTTIVPGNAFTVDWYNATAATDYVASYNATNAYYIWVTDSRILPGQFTAGHTIDWTTLGIPSSGLAIFLILGGFLVTSVANRDLGVLAGASVAACTDYLGMSNIGAGIIIIAGAIGVFIAIRGVTR